MGEMADMTFVDFEDEEEPDFPTRNFYKCPKCGVLTFGRGGPCYECKEGIREVRP